MKIKKNKISLYLLFLFVNQTIFSQIKMYNYDVFIGEVIDMETDNSNFIILRKFDIVRDSVVTINYLGVNINTLETKLIKSNNVYERSWDFLVDKYYNSNYIKLYRYAAQLNKGELYNSGLTKISSLNCFAITLDLCPSSSTIEYNFFNNYGKLLFQEDSVILPIGIAISGLWMKHHKKEFNWLIEQEKEKKFAVTWINHSYNHNYVKGNSLSNNFFLIKNTNVKKEILDTEQMLIQNNLIPSIYFRFPGLVSNRKLYSQIMDYGLIPLGSDSWIAKNQFPKNGSIVLLHGNGNETVGITMFLNWIKENRKKYCITSINQLCLKYFESDK